MTITISGSHPTTVEASGSTTTTSPSNALQDINDSIVGIIDTGATVDGFGLAIESSQGTLNPGSTIQVTNNGTVSTNQNSNAALTIGAAGPVVPPGTFGDFSYTGSGNITDTGAGAEALSISDPTGNVSVTVSATSTIAGSTTGGGIEASSGADASSTGTVKVTVDAGGTVEGQTAVSFGNGVATLDNSGIVQGTGSLSSGVGGQAATVTNSGTISGTTIGVGVENVTLTNKSGATIETTNTTSAEAALAAIAAVEALTAADITNQLGATIQATGPLGQVGILVGQAGATGTATVHNDGMISAVGNAINTNTSGLTTITNSGTISNTTGGGATPGDIRVNVASITNSATGAISGADVGILFRNSQTTGSTIFNAGTISGTTAAIQFSSASSGNTLTLAPGFTITGNVTQGAGNILQLGGSSGAGSFDLGKIGTQYLNFTTFNKIDTSTWTLTGTGAAGWTVEQGTLQVDGTIGDSTVQSGGTLDGTGTTGALTVLSGGTLAPGDDPGTITTGNLNLETGATLSVEIEGTSPGVGGFDQVDVNGSVTLGGALSFTLLNGFAPTTGETFELINNDGNDAVNGTFFGLAEGATFTQGGVTYSISYAGGDGNDVVLTVGNAPPPPMNAPPTLSATTTSATYVENAAGVALFSAANASTVEAGQSIIDLDLTVGSVSDGTEILNIDGSDVALTNGTSVTTSGNGLSASVVLSGSTATVSLAKSAGVSTATLDSIIDGITYRDSGDNPTGGTRTVTLTSLQDNGGTANGGSDTTSGLGIASTVNVVPVDDPPAVTLGVTLGSYTENDPATAIAPAASVTDVDSPNFNGGSLTASSSGLPQDQLSILTDATVTVSGGVVSVGGSEIGSVNATHNGVNGAALEIDFDSANATPAAVTTLLDHIAYADSSDDPSTTPRMMTFSVNDGGSTANGGNPIGTGSAAFNVVAVNDAPTVSAPASYAPSPMITISGVTFGDVDAEGGQELATFVASSGTFMVTPAGQALGAVGNGTNTVTLLATIANLNSFIANGDLVLTGAATGATVAISIDDEGHTGQGPAGGITSMTTANVLSGPVLTAGAPVAGTEGSSTGTLKLASFTDAAITNPMVGNFSATIDWGDGTAPSSGTITAEGGGVFDVNGSHTYTEENSYMIQVSVNDGSATGSTTDSAMIGDAALTATGQAITGTGGTAINNAAVATFTDANPDGMLGDFSATIDWGDGTAPSTGTVVAVNGGGFAVDGSHTYQGQGSFTTTVTITDDGGSHKQVNGSASIALLSPNNPPPPAGTTADMITTQAVTNNYFIYNIGNSTVLASHPLTNIAPPWQVVGLGNFSGADTSDMMLRNTSTGSFEVVDVSNNKVSGPFQLGNVGLEWQVAGFGDFSSRPGETDMLTRNTHNGDFELYNFNNNTVTFATDLGNVGLDWQVLGFGDFSGRANETDMLTRNSNTQMVELYELSNNQVTSATMLGDIGFEWQFAGAGDFSGRPGETDLLMRDTNNGNFEIYDFQNGKITSVTQLGNVGLNWTVAGVADFSSHANESDLLLRDSSTGDFELDDISNNAVTSTTMLGNVGLDWHVDGTAPYQLTTSMAPASEEVQGPSASLAVSDPVGAGGWSSEMTQMPQSGIDGWLTQAMQASAPAPAFDAGSDPIAGTAPSGVFATPNPLQTHTA